MSPNAPADAPTPELLLDVRTPAELAFSPDETRLAFALHATVADEGSFVPSDLYVIDTDGHHPPVQLTSGPWSDRTPAWSPDGSQLAFLSDRITPGHQLPYTVPAIGTDGAAVAPRLAATLTGSAESVAWSSDGGRLLVLAADPGSYGLDWSARAVNGATPTRRPNHETPRRRGPPPVPRRSRDRPRRGGRPGGSERVGVRLGRRRHPRRARLGGPLRLRLVPVGRGPSVPRHPDGRDALRAHLADGEPGALARSRPRDRRRGLRERPRSPLRQHRRDRSRHEHHYRPVARPADGRTRLVV